MNNFIKKLQKCDGAEIFFVIANFVCIPVDFYVDAWYFVPVHLFLGVVLSYYVVKDFKND